MLVNLTNDGWFWGSSELDMHLVCGVFRAVECRKPFLIAANTGFSAWIDGDGRIRQQGPRRAKDVILAEPRSTGRRSWYLEHGDWFAGVCLAACGLCGLVGIVRAARGCRRGARLHNAVRIRAAYTVRASTSCGDVQAPPQSMALHACPETAPDFPAYAPSG